ncbi:virus coat protein [Maize white line mosaic virus]|uniref:Capsid protein n=1 Tax=Maize white line mosaic virus TaxID=445227 RepID=A5YVA6_9TOMB|nr:unnamed protein product [Maize white line mosaic virus]ABQ65751.1 virus coat protein [Maize white line mosaic virus]
MARKKRSNQVQTGQGVRRAAGAVITAPVARTRQVRARPPKVEALAGGGFRVTHRELITTIANSATYQANGGIAGLKYRMNPTYGSTLTWCPALASNFDQYVFRKLTLEYVPTCGTTETGRVGIWFDRDSEDDPPADRVELASMGVLVETAPWSGVTLQVPTDNTKRFCLGAGGNTDAKLIDLGQIGFSTYAGAGTNAVGDLFAEYVVDLHCPQPSGALVQTLRITSAGVRGPEVGPLYYNMTKAATLIDLTFFTPGTFLISIGCAATSYTSELVLGGATLNSRTLTATGAGFSGSFNVTVTKPLDGLRIQGTGFGDCMTFAVRARVANSVTV